VTEEKKLRTHFLILGTFLPEDILKDVFIKDTFPHVQDYKFIKNFVSSLIYTKKVNLSFVSYLNVSDYPFFPQKIVKKIVWSTKINNEELSGISVPFINTPISKVITRFFSMLFYGYKTLLKNKKTQGIIVYGAYLPSLVSGYILSKTFKVPLIGILTDPPALSNSRDNKIKKYLRKIEKILTSLFLKKVNKLIVVNENLAIDFSPQTPYIVVNGFIDRHEFSNAKNKDENIETNKNTIIFAYTGSIEKKYGIKELVEGFLKASVENAVLEICGRGDFDNELREISKNYRNIIYHGFVLPDKALEIQRRAHFLINTRPLNESYTKYSFPSKMLEYMASGKPIITTLLPGMEPYKDFLIILEDNNPETISKIIRKLCLDDYSKYIAIGIKAKEFVLKNNTIEALGEKILNFLLF